MINECTNEELWPQLANDDLTHIVLAYGASCGPCIKTKPHFQMVANLFTKLDLSIRFYQIDVWNSINTAFKQVITLEAVPTIIYYKNGKEVSRIRGSKESLEIRDFIQKTTNELKGE